MVNYKRVNKATARKMYNHGCSILLLPCKVGESALYESTSQNHWVRPYSMSLMTSEEETNRFDRAVNTYEYYNCNAELGYYAHYYVSEEELDKYNTCKLMCM